ncbi:MAG: hypothetical protein Q9162_004699 [Coniocarpon cinnabarinum]
MAAESKLDLHERHSDGPLDLPEGGKLSSPSAEPDFPELVDNPFEGESQPPPKRKGGRKPIYATVEERKQRNRQAQAAFRERRSEYIKQLEITLDQHEELLQVARREQQATAYQSSSLQRRIGILERILRENGIDLEAELSARGEQTVMSQETPTSLSGLESHSATGQRRSIKQSTSPGNTKLDQLKSKAASMGTSLVSPLHSPQSQLPSWNEASPSSPTVASPSVSTYDPTGAPVYTSAPSGFHMRQSSNDSSVFYRRENQRILSDNRVPASVADDVALQRQHEWQNRPQANWQGNKGKTWSFSGCSSEN